MKYFVVHFACCGGGTGKAVVEFVLEGELALKNLGYLKLQSVRSLV